MEEAQRSDLYYSLWEEFLTETLLPEFRRRHYSHHYPTQVQLTPRLRQHRFDAKLYPFIYERIWEFMESMCESYMSHKGNDIRKRAIPLRRAIARIKMVFDICTNMDANAIATALAPLKIAFLETTSSPVGWAMPIVPMITEIFRKCVYSKLADCLREAAFRTISDDFKVQDPFSLSSYLQLIRRMGDELDLVLFVTEEWDEPLYVKVSKRMSESISEWCRMPLAEFLKNTETLIQDCNKIFFSFETGVGKDVVKQIANARDFVLFKHDAEHFKQMLSDASNSETLKHLMNQFHMDKEFLKTMAHHASQFYSDLIYGRGQDEDHELLKEEKTVKKLLPIWFQVHKLLGQENVKKPAVQDALVDPFLAFTKLVPNYPETIMKELTELLCELLSKSTKGHQKLNQASLEKLVAMTSLGSLLSPGEHFPDVLRRFMSKYLLQVSYEDINTGMLPEQNSTNDKSDNTEGLSLILKDARNWVSYRSEMSTILQHLQEVYENTQLDFRFVRKSFWDLGPDVDLMLPESLKTASDKIIQSFESHYPTRTAAIHSLAGQMIIRSSVWTHKGNGLRIVLSTGQGCVLARFGHQTVSLEELLRNVLVNRNKNIGLPALVAILKSLMNEYPIIKKKPENSDFCETDTFSLNLQFQPTSGLIELPCPNYNGESDGSSSKAGRNNFSAIDLEQVLRAAVMKLLKRERELEMNQLRNMVVEHLSSLYDLSEVRFEEVVAKLEADDCVSVDNSVVRYIV